MRPSVLPGQGCCRSLAICFAGSYVYPDRASGGRDHARPRDVASSSRGHGPHRRVGDNNVTPCQRAALFRCHGGNRPPHRPAGRALGRRALGRHRHRRLGARRDDRSPGMRSSRSWRGGRGRTARVWAIATVALRLPDRRFPAGTITACVGTVPQLRMRALFIGCRSGAAKRSSRSDRGLAAGSCR